MSPSDHPSKPGGEGHRNYFYRAEAARALNVKAWRVLEFEKEGKLHPARDQKGRRRYRKSEVTALAMQLATVAPKAGALEAQVLELIDSGQSDAQIVKALRVPMGTVRALRSAANGEEPEEEATSTHAEPTAEERAFLHQAETDLEASRAQIRAGYDQRRKADR